MGIVFFWLALLGGRCEARQATPPGFFSCPAEIHFTCSADRVKTECNQTNPNLRSVCILDSNQSIPVGWQLSPPSVPIKQSRFHSIRTAHHEVGFLSDAPSDDMRLSGCSSLTPGSYAYKVTNVVDGFYDMDPDRDTFTWGYCMFVAQGGMATVVSQGTWKPFNYSKFWTVEGGDAVSICKDTDQSTCGFVPLKERHQGAQANFVV